MRGSEPVVTSQPAATLRSRYVEQAASDLEENRRRQRELTEKLTMLKQEEALLMDILTLAERYEGSVDGSRPPEQAQSQSSPGQERHAPGAVPLPADGASRRPSRAGARHTVRAAKRSGAK